VTEKFNDGKQQMRKVYFYLPLKVVLLALLLGALAACGKDDLKKGTAEVANVPAQYDLTILADKDGAFDFDGATLTAEDLRGHIRYLDEAGRPVKTILLKRGEKEKIKNTHVSELAGMARDLKVTAYVQDNDGHLKIIQVVE
jgi:type IV pilus biogenesis protein CpaD/CtpE